MDTPADKKKLVPLSYRITSKLISFMPQWILFPVSRLGGFVHYLSSAEKRGAYIDNLRGVIPNHHHFKPWTAFQNHALNILELLKAPSENADDILDRLTIHGREYLDQAMGDNKGLIIATVHCGNWELSGLGLALLGYPITTIAGEQLSDGWSDSIKDWKRLYGIRVLSPEHSLRDLYRDLRAGRIIVLHMDGNLYSKGIELTFLGKSTRIPRGPAHLSRITGASLCLAYCMRRNRNHLEIHFHDAITPPRSEQAEVDVTKKLIADIEECILAEPGQWCIFRRI
jgi:KDO2-lipid IV(A) lauroyltransferase